MNKKEKKRIADDTTTKLEKINSEIRKALKKHVIPGLELKAVKLTLAPKETGKPTPESAGAAEAESPGECEWIDGHLVCRSNG
jgi:hypothetical protein